MLITREEFNKRQAEIANRASFQSGPQVGFFSLKNDGDEAIVRFMCDSPDEFPLVLQHATRIGDGKFKTISCLREGYHDSYDKCPLCKAGDKASTQVYIQLIQYERDDDGNITATPKVWARSNSWVQQNLIPKWEEYESLKDIVCKIKRHGAPNQTGVQYVVTKLNSTIYSDDKYVKDEHAFDGYEVVGRAVRVMDFNQMSDLVRTVAADVPQVVRMPEYSAVGSQEVMEPFAMHRRVVAEDLPF